MLGPGLTSSTHPRRSGALHGPDSFQGRFPEAAGEGHGCLHQAGSRAPVSRSLTSAQLTATTAPFPLVGWLSEASRLPSHTDLFLSRNPFCRRSFHFPASPLHPSGTAHAGFSARSLPRPCRCARPNSFVAAPAGSSGRRRPSLQPQGYVWMKGLRLPSGLFAALTLYRPTLMVYGNWKQAMKGKLLWLRRAFE